MIVEWKAIINGEKRGASVEVSEEIVNQIGVIKSLEDAMQRLLFNARKTFKEK